MPIATLCSSNLAKDPPPLSSNSCFIYFLSLHSNYFPSSLASPSLQTFCFGPRRVLDGTGQKKRRRRAGKLIWVLSSDPLCQSHVWAGEWCACARRLRRSTHLERVRWWRVWSREKNKLFSQRPTSPKNALHSLPSYLPFVFKPNRSFAATQLHTLLFKRTSNPTGDRLVDQRSCQTYTFCWYALIIFCNLREEDFGHRWREGGSNLFMGIFFIMWFFDT